MDHEHRLTNSLQLLMNTLVFGMAADVMLEDPACLPVLQNTIVQLPRHRFELGQVAQTLPDPKVREQVRAEFQKLLFRAVIGDVLRLTDDWCRSSLSEAERDALAWYPFAKVVRNALSHNLRLSLREKYFRGRLPITWRHRTVTAQMHGMKLGDDVDYSDALDLFLDIQNTVRERSSAGG